MEINCSAFLDYCNCSLILNNIQCEDVYIYDNPLANYIIYSFLVFSGILIGGIIIFNISLEYMPDSLYQKYFRKRQNCTSLNSNSDSI